MNINSMKLWQLGLVVLAAATFMAGLQDVAMANPLDILCGKVNDVWTWGQKAIYIVGGIGVLVCAIFAFIGRFRWSLLFAIAGGVFLVATTTQLFIWLGGTGINGCH